MPTYIKGYYENYVSLPLSLELIYRSYGVNMLYYGIDSCETYVRSPLSFPRNPSSYTVDSVSVPCILRAGRGQGTRWFGKCGACGMGNLENMGDIMGDMGLWIYGGMNIRDTGNRELERERGDGGYPEGGKEEEKEEENKKNLPITYPRPIPSTLPRPVKSQARPNCRSRTCITFHSLLTISDRRRKAQTTYNPGPSLPPNQGQRRRSRSKRREEEECRVPSPTLPFAATEVAVHGHPPRLEGEYE